jgi:hypothetical protein
VWTYNFYIVNPNVDIDGTPLSYKELAFLFQNMITHKCHGLSSEIRAAECNHMKAVWNMFEKAGIHTLTAKDILDERIARDELIIAQHNATGTTLLNQE